MAIVPTRGTKLWEETATARTISMQSSEGIRDQPSPGEVGGCETSKSLQLTPLNWPRGGQKSGDSNQRQQCIMPPARRPNTTEI